MFLDPTYGIKNCFFRLPELIEGLKDMPKGSAVLFDEKTREYGQGSQRMAAEYENLVQVVRKYQLSLLNCAVVPRMKDLAHYELETLFIDRQKRVVHCGLLYPTISAGASFVSFELMGYVEIPHPDTVLPPEFITEYEKRKDTFIDEHMLKSSGDYIADSAHKIMKLDEFKFLLKDYTERARPKLPPKRELFEIVARQFPHLRRNVECAAIAETILSECRRDVRGKLNEALEAEGAEAAPESG
jgi:hypothetical protein